MLTCGSAWGSAKVSNVPGTMTGAHLGIIVLLRPSRLVFIFALDMPDHIFHLVLDTANESRQRLFRILRGLTGKCLGLGIIDSAVEHQGIVCWCCEMRWFGRFERF
jgi:hypothetical protein